MRILFYELIRIAIGTQDCLTRQPKASEWGELYKIAEKQSLIGICFVGLQNIGEDEVFAKIGIPEELYFLWMCMAVRIQQRNEELNRLCVKLQARLAADGYQSCILKGQGTASLYESLAKFRQSGDIDTWMIAEPETVIEWARKTGKMYYYDYHHADLSIFDNTEVELHYRPTLSRNLVRNMRLQKWFKEEGAQHIVFNQSLGFSVPDYAFNVILTLNHNFWHLMYEGVGMRQMLDLYFVLKSCSEQGFKNDVVKLLKHMRLKRFASACMWVMKEILGLEEKYLLCEPEENVGKFLLDEIMQAGNFGQHDKRLKKGRYKNRCRLMLAWVRHASRLFKYYPFDVLWTPVGILRISLWRRWHYRKENEMKNKEI